MLTDALHQRAPGTKVRSLEIDAPIWGTATKAFLRLDYEHRGPAGPPEALCLKATRWSG